jgi:hypothetical protein
VAVRPTGAPGRGGPPIGRAPGPPGVGRYTEGPVGRGPIGPRAGPSDAFRRPGPSGGFRTPVPSDGCPRRVPSAAFRRRGPSALGGGGPGGRGGGATAAAAARSCAAAAASRRPAAARERAAGEARPPARAPPPARPRCGRARPPSPRPSARRASSRAPEPARRRRDGDHLGRRRLRGLGRRGHLLDDLDAVQRALLRSRGARLVVANDQLLGSVRPCPAGWPAPWTRPAPPARLDVHADRLQQEEHFLAADPHLGGQFFDSDLSHVSLTYSLTPVSSGASALGLRFESPASAFSRTPPA